MTREQAIQVLLKIPYKYGKAVGFKKLTALHNEWIMEMVGGKEDITYQAHRGSYKTTCVALAIAIIMILFPNKKIAFFRKTDTAVKEIIIQVRKILEHPVSRLIIFSIWGVELCFTRNSATELNTNLTNDPRGISQLTGVGTKSAITGKHYDIIFTDDIITLVDRVSRAEREATKLFYQELRNLINRGGRIVNTGTPWHQEDAFTLMPNIHRYDCYTTGLISKAELEEIRKSMTNSLFAANYELKHVADDDVLFTNPKLGAEIELITNGTAHVDSAYYGEDYTAFTIVAIHDGKFYVFGKCWRKHVDDCMDDIMSYYNQFLCSKLYTETNADKGYSARELKKKGARVVTYHEDMNKYLKISTYLKGDWDNIEFVEGTDDLYIDQICDYNEDAEHDDCPDSLASLIRKLKKKRERGEQPKEYHSIIGL